MNDFLRLLDQPEYVHVFLHPIPIYGVAIGALALIVSMLWRKRHAQVIALLILCVSALTAWPVAEFGEDAKDRVKTLSERKDDNSWLEIHEERAEDAVWIFYVAAGAALLALVVPARFPRATLPLNSLALLAAIAAIAAGGYISYAGGKIRHREFRNGPPPVAELRKKRD